MEAGSRGEKRSGVDVDFLFTERAPEPEPVCDDRAADFGAVVVNAVDLVDAREIGTRFAGNLWRSLIRVARVEVASRPFELVRAAFGHHVELCARGLNTRIRAARRDLHL